MSLKGKGLLMLMASMAMMGGTGMPEPYRAPKRKKEYFPFDIDLAETPKGHKLDSLFIEYTRGNYKYSADIQFSYGSVKQKMNRLIRRQKEMQNYINETPHELIVKFNQFKIEEIQSLIQDK